ncbi:hypothetical protein D3C72_2423500 [compost metagenome]
MQQSRFAAAGRTHQRDQFPGLDFTGEAIHDGQVAEVFMDVIEGQIHGTKRVGA